MIPPLAAEIGAAAPLGEATPLANSTELRVGAHSASLAWMPTRFDVGIGFSGTYRTLSDASTVSMHGLYFSFAYAIERRRHWRTFVGARVDSFTGDYQDRSLQVVGGAVRVGAELFSAGARGVSDRNLLAFMAGTFAVGVYVEGTARTLPTELGPLGVGAGVSMRVPFILAVGN
jgi:hypothetical protein